MASAVGPREPTGADPEPTGAGPEPTDAAREPTGAGPEPRAVRLSSGAFADGAARLLAGILRQASDRSGAVCVALAGGSTPGPVYERLAGTAGIAWDRVCLFFGDERRVPPDHAESNYRMVRETLLSRLPVSPRAVHRMEGEAPDPESEAARYAALLPDALNLLVLGIGADGHTASLFPGSPALRETARKVVPVTAPRPPRERFTIAPPVIRSARRVVVLATGAEKAEAVRAALDRRGDVGRCPARLARRGTWVLDENAASRLPGAGGRP